ncbi:MAG: AAA family ATPase [Acidobacteriota bacterium]
MQQAGLVGFRAILETTVEKLRTMSTTGSQPYPSDYCDLCADTGWQNIIGEGARMCTCPKGDALRALKSSNPDTAINTVPRRYQSLRIETMQPMIHPKQAELLPRLRANPRASVVMYGAGNYGCGKSAIGWALFQSARDAGRPVFGCNLSAFIKAMQRWSIEGIAPAIKPEDVRKWRDGLVWLDEMDKVDKISRFAAQQLFEMVNACYEQDVQIIAATNLSKLEIAAFWSEAGDTYGPAINRRLFQADGVIGVDFGKKKKEQEHNAA